MTSAMVKGWIVDFGLLIWQGERSLASSLLESCLSVPTLMSSYESLDGSDGVNG